MLVLVCLLTLLASSSTPAECAFLTSSQAADGDILGRSASASGSTLMVGGHQLGNGGPGLLCVYEEANGVWTETQTLLPSDVSAGDQFGGSVSVSGNRALIGARLHSLNLMSAGAAYVYEEVGGVWSRVAKLEASDAQERDYFGYSVSLDGDVAAVGAFGDNEGGDLGGSAYVFEYDGVSWSQTAKLAHNSGSGSVRFGREVAVGDGVIAVGAYVENAVYIFEKSLGTWHLSTKVKPADAQAGDDFGWSVSVDNGRVLVGARFDDGTGACYVYEKLIGGWTRTHTIKASDGGTLDEFGANVRIDGDRLCVGAPGATGVTAGTGAAYVYEFVGSAWLETDKLVNTNGVSGEVYGNAVALGDSYVVVTAPHDSTLAAQSGAALVYCGLEPSTLVGSPPTISLAVGGDHRLSMDLGPALGSAFYWVWGSMSGTTPGTLVDGVPLPLNPDAYTSLTMGYPYSSFFENYVGFLAPDGTRTATLEVPPGLDPSYAGVTIHHSVIVSSDLQTIAAASNASSVLLLP